MNKLLIVILYFIIVLFLLEAVLYFAGIPKDYKPHIAPVQFQSTVGMKSAWTNQRSKSIDFIYDRNPRGYFRDNNTVRHITNGAGFRGPEILQEQSKTVYRVLFLGDSITFGEGVYFKDTYPEQFKNLAQNDGLFNGKTVESINAGVGGYNTRNEYTLLEDIVGFYKIKPDRIVVGYYLNDADETLFKVNSNGEFTRIASGPESFIDSTKKMPELFKIFRTFRIAWNWYIGKVITEKTVDYYHAAYREDSLGWLETKRAINDFGNFQRTTGIPITFMIFPALFRLNDYPFMVEQGKVVKELEDNNLEYISLLPLLSKYTGPELWVHPTDQHPNEIVHKIVAEALISKFSNLKLDQ